MEREGASKNRALLKSGPTVALRIDRALADVIDLHRQAQSRRWYGKKIVSGEITGTAARSWKRFPKLYARIQKALNADPLLQTLRETPKNMWLLPPRGNPKKRRNGALKKALTAVGLTKLQVDDVIHALGWTIR